MSVLLFSSDQEAGGMLSSALARHEIPYVWKKELAHFDDPPLVTVVDAELSGYGDMLKEIRERAPWSRAYLMARPGTRSSMPRARVVHKPFDATSFAQALRSDYQLAALDKQRRSETHKLETELLHSQRLAHLGRISATMSHEINNPLAVIRSCAAWLNGYAEQNRNSDLAETVKDLELASERIVGFVDQMGGFARKGAPDLRRTPLNKTLEVALRMVRPRAQSKGAELAFARTPSLIEAVVHDSPRMSQAIINLVSNAIDAAAEGGGKVWIDVQHLGAHVRVAVMDNGPGIPANYRKRLFEPFVTTKPHGHGTGLGLALSRDILLEHGGDVVLNDRDGGGTVAELIWPADGPESSRTGGG